MTYDYECKSCGTFEVEQSIKDEPLQTCPTCNSSCRRLISCGTSFQLKGEGWGRDLYSKSKGGTE